MNGVAFRPLGLTLLEPGNLAGEPFSGLVDPRRKFPAQLVQLIDYAGEMLHGLEIGRPDCLAHAKIVLLPCSLQLAQRSSALQAMLRKRVNPEPVILVPDPLLRRGECEFGAASVAQKIVSTYQYRGQMEQFCLSGSARTALA